MSSTSNHTLKRRKFLKKYPKRSNRQSCEFPSQELLSRALRIGGANKITIEAASELKCAVCSETNPPKRHLLAKLADAYTEFNQGVGADLFVPADSDEQVFEFLFIVNLPTRLNICFPVQSKRPDNVLSVLEMVWINWAGPMRHLISDMGGEFEGELGVCMEAHGIRQYFTASEAPWQNGLVERNGGIWKAAARKVIKDVGARGFVDMRRIASMVNWATNARVNSSGYSPAQWVIGRGYKLPWSLLDEKKNGERASLELPDHSPEFGRRMSWLWAARRAFENTDTSHRLRRALLAWCSS